MFVFTYRTPKDYVPFQPDTVPAWTEWFRGMGADLVNRGEPVREARQIGDCGTGQRLGGFSVVTADDFAAALELARGCPGLDNGFGVEVGALTEQSDD